MNKDLHQDMDTIEMEIIFSEDKESIWDSISDLCEKYGTEAVLNKLSKKRHPKLWEFLKD